MSVALQTAFVISLSTTLTNTQTVFSAQSSPKLAKTYNWASGVAKDQADKLYVARLSLTTTPTDLDLAGSLVDPLGVVVTFAKIAALMIVNNSTTAGENVLIGGDASAAFAGLFGDVSDKLILGPDGTIAAANPSLAAYAVTGTTADILQLAASTGTISCDVGIVGRSA